MFSKLFKKHQHHQEESADTFSYDLTLATAILYLEVAWADHDISGDEIDEIKRLLGKHFFDDDIDLNQIVEESTKLLNDSPGLQSYTRLINSEWNEAQKFNLIQNLWSLALTDEKIDSLEEHTIRKIADLIYLDHARFIQAKLTAKRALQE
tara:strand:- start:187 stop:639 length:453 start_codon:yes stop_codon:yes gene_type:complete